MDSNRVEGELTIMPNGIISFRGETPSGVVIMIDGGCRPRPQVLIRSTKATFTFDDLSTLDGAHFIISDCKVSYITAGYVNIEAARNPQVNYLRLNGQHHTAICDHIILQSGSLNVRVIRPPGDGYLLS